VALLHLGKNEDAIAHFDKALQIEPNLVDSLSSKGTALDSMGRHNEAIGFYNKALQIQPNDPVALNGKGVEENKQ
jgi:Flp pilus assembly protein TadD